MFRRLRPAIVHTHNPKPGLYGRIAARVARVPVVVNTIHGLYAQPQDALAEAGGGVLDGTLRRALCARRARAEPRRHRDARAPRRPAPQAHAARQRHRPLAFRPGDRLGRRRGGRRAPSSARAGPTTWWSGWSAGSCARRATPRCSRRRAVCATTCPRLRFAIIGDDDHEKDDALERRRPRRRGRGRRSVSRPPFRHAAPLRGHGSARARLAPRGLSPFADGSGGDGRPRGRDEHPRLPPGRRRRRHRPAGSGARSRRARGGDRRRWPVRRSRWLAFGRAARQKARREFDDRRCVEITLETYRRLLERGERRERSRVRSRGA